MVDGASAANKKKIKKPDSAGVVVNKGGNRLSPSRGESAPTLLKNPMTYYIGVPSMVGVAGAWYGLCHLLSKGEKKEEDFHMKDEKGKVSKKDNEESSDEVFELGSIINLDDGGLLSGLNVEIRVFLGSYHCHIREFDGESYVGVSRWVFIGGVEFPFEFYHKINKIDSASVATALGVACAGFESVFTFLSDKAIGDRSKFISENCVVDENGNMSNRVDGKVFNANKYLGHLRDKLSVKNSNKLLADEVFKRAKQSFTIKSVDNASLKLNETLAKAGKEIYVNEDDGKLYLRNIKKK